MIIKEVTKIMRKLNNSEFEGVISFFNIKKNNINSIIEDVNEYIEKTEYYVELERFKNELYDNQEKLNKYFRYKERINIIILILVSLFVLYLMLILPDYSKNTVFSINYYMIKYSILFILPCTYCLIILLYANYKIIHYTNKGLKIKNDLDELREYICYLKNSNILVRINEEFNIYTAKKNQ